MQLADSAHVLGRFDSARVQFADLATTLIHRDTSYIANTEGEDGRLHDYTVRYTFGVYPLQQYLVSLDSGRLQPLPVAWDARPAAQGGQRWFWLDSGPRAAHTDEFHWTSRQRNWNYMCADCHSTAVRKQYDATSASFHTTWSSIDVSCEACHGPGSEHVAWGKRPSFVRKLWSANGLTVALNERRGVQWTIDATSGNAKRSAPRVSDAEVQTCARCHSRRTQIADADRPGLPLLDHYVPSLLISGLYYPDGQQRDEVYNYGSFVQSRMFHAGVTCSDCHNPHSGRPRANGNALCAQCHAPAKYDAPAHTMHAAGSTGATCVACHMPTATYMQIDQRADHSIRIPNPALAQEVGAPNACAACHRDRDAAWAAQAIRAHFGHDPNGYQHFARAFAADDRNTAGAGDSLVRIATDAAEPAFIRASALARLRDRPSQASLNAASEAITDPDPLVRRSAIIAVEAIPAEQRIPIATRLLRDSVRAVRLEATWALAPAATALTGDAQTAFARVTDEYVASQRYNADRAENRLTLGTFFAELGRWNEAASELSAAISMAPKVGEAYANLADVRRAQGRDGDAIATLRTGIAAAGADPRLHYALGLAYARTADTTGAVSELRRAHQLSPDDVTIGTGLMIALRSAGHDAEGRQVGNALIARYPGDERVLSLLRAYGWTR